MYAATAPIAGQVLTKGSTLRSGRGTHPVGTPSDQNTRATSELSNATYRVADVGGYAQFSVRLGGVGCVEHCCSMGHAHKPTHSLSKPSRAEQLAPPDTSVTAADRILARRARENCDTRRRCRQRERERERVTERERRHATKKQAGRHVCSCLALAARRLHTTRQHGIL